MSGGVEYHDGTPGGDSPFPQRWGTPPDSDVERRAWIVRHINTDAANGYRRELLQRRYGPAE